VGRRVGELAGEVVAAEPGEGGVQGDGRKQLKAKEVEKGRK
jgi:hypothetical protein